MSKARILPQVRENFKIDSLIDSAQNIGSISQEEAQKLNSKLFKYQYGSCKNGLAIKIYWALNEEERIIDCKMEVFGEVELIAVASIGALIARNKTPKEILELKEKGLEYFLRENPNKVALPNSYRYLTNVVIDALYSASKAYSNELEKSEIVDELTGASLQFIKDSIKRFNIETLEDLVDVTRAGAYDKNCLYQGAGDRLCNYYLSDILKETIEQMQQEQKKANAVVDKDFKDMTIDEKRASIDAIIDKNIRHMLVMDGGDMEILDIKENGENTDVYIRYLGACSGCASASGGTLFAIEGILKQKLSDKIRVIPL